jgi:hypothetical protein
MRTRIVMGVAATALLLVGILAGMVISGGIAAFAAKGAGSSNSVAGASQSPAASTAGYCQLYVQTLATKLGVTQSRLEGDNSAALQTVITQMAKDGTITSKQESALQQALQKYGNQPCSHLGELAQMARGEYAGWKMALKEARQSIAASVAASLGITAQTLAADLQAGQTIPQIASARHVALSTVNLAYLSAVHKVLNQAVSNGDLTQTKANAIFNRVTSAVSAGHYPLLGGWKANGS